MKQPTHRPEAPRRCGKHLLQTAVDVHEKLQGKSLLWPGQEGQRGTRPQTLTLPMAASPQPWHSIPARHELPGTVGRGGDGGSAVTASQAQGTAEYRSSSVLLSFMKSKAYRELPPLPKVVNIDLNFSLVQHNLSNERSTSDSAVPSTTGSFRQQLPQAFQILFH